MENVESGVRRDKQTVMSSEILMHKADNLDYLLDKTWNVFSYTSRSNITASF